MIIVHYCQSEMYENRNISLWSRLRHAPTMLESECKKALRLLSLNALKHHFKAWMMAAIPKRHEATFSLIAMMIRRFLCFRILMPSDRSGTIPERVSLKYRSERISRRSYDYRPAKGCRDHPLAAPMWNHWRERLNHSERSQTSNSMGCADPSHVID